MVAARWGLVLVFGFLMGCSSDDDALPQEEEDQGFAKFSYLSFDDEAFYEYGFSAGSQELSERNLTLEEGLVRNIGFVHQQQGVVGFYGFRTVYLRDVRNKMTRQFQDFVSPGNTERREQVVNNATTIALLYRFPPGFEELRLRIINTGNNVIHNIGFGDIPDQGSYVYLRDETVIVTYENGDDAGLVVLDGTTGTIRTTFIFEDNGARGVAFGDMDDFYFFDDLGNYHRYDISTLDLLETAVTDFFAFNGVVYEMHDQKIYGSYSYLQPSEFIDAPQVFDLTGNTSARIDLQQKYFNYAAANENVSRIANTEFAYDFATDTWLSNYIITDAAGKDIFGIFRLDNEGNILSEMQLEHFAWRIVVE